MELHINQTQINQICQALWAISHAFEYIATAIIYSAILRAIANK